MGQKKLVREARMFEKDCFKPNEFIDWLKLTIPDGAADVTATLEYDEDDQSQWIMVYFSREETDEEGASRLRSEMERVRAQEHDERILYEKLKAKYG